MKTKFQFTNLQKLTAVAIVALVFVYTIVLAVVVMRNRASADQTATNATGIKPLETVEGLPPAPVMQSRVPDVMGPALPIYIGQTTVPVLMYHYVRDVSDPNDTVGQGLSVSPMTFDRQMKYLADNNFTSTGFDTLLSNNVPSRPIVITFDDGYKDAVTNALPVLRKYRLKAVFYIITDRIGQDSYVSADDIRQLVADGMIIGSHTRSHPDMTQASASAVDEQLTASKSALENIVGAPVTDFCYPSGRLNDAVATAVSKAGYKTAVTTKSGVVATGSQFLRLPRMRITNDTNLDTILRAY